MTTNTATKYETVIGLEVHAQLLTNSKMFCSCSTDYAGKEPNTHVCPVCLGMPGVLPVINKKAVQYTIMTALALNCEIPEYTKFDRKNYPYPDLVKGYQISQFDMPLSLNGWINVTTDDQTRRIGITRVHLEEDTARLMHRQDPSGETYSLVDVNRSCSPLMEIVGEPDIRSPEEARQYLMQLRSIVQYLGVSTGNMEEGTFRCDANISIRPEGMKELTTKVEIKNMNSFKAVYSALDYEVKRQQEVIGSGGTIVQETRGWDDASGTTNSQRSKEHAHDYRYFPEPDLPPLAISKTWVDQLKANLPELPVARRQRFIDDCGLSEYDASLLTATKIQADWFEQAVKLSSKNSAKAITNWMNGELARLLNSTGTDFMDTKITPQNLVALIDLIDKGTISNKLAKTVFEEMFATGKKPAGIIEAKGLTQVSDSGQIDGIIEKAIEDNPNAIADIKAGKEQALKFLVGQVMKLSRGRANPQMVNKLLIERFK
ncbi:MAG: Asp-tRNA(Asn)/Glu-tRNA(Gln) amidotransferase subunit GatB [Chloroflexi bacterium]|jgi:aspartyl-tRNA(Asn)/glutamyl-tRNA(Gln) amidotransferase subunit B|nr:Asp-tRNA(Asn)/Glu-tRNA(Gln) amidotransferase subunit GatB [Chloroflexota bacterium]MBT7081549.1 Asp-tRNA(Asn)/Glu-tRNA(Gln) amidotransferase subunit GatB [Chloroflexota bacterium]